MANRLSISVPERIGLKYAQMGVPGGEALSRVVDRVTEMTFNQENSAGE